MSEEKPPAGVRALKGKNHLMRGELARRCSAFGAIAEEGAQWCFLEHGLRLIAYSRYERNFEEPEEYASGDLISPMIMASCSRWGWIAGQQFWWEWRTPDRWRGSAPVKTMFLIPGKGLAL